MVAAEFLLQPPPVQRTATAYAPIIGIQIHLLGSLRVLVNSIDVTARIKYRKGIALLALLSIECNLLHPREHLADLFWPTLSLQAARTNLRQVLSNLSSVLSHSGTSDNSALQVNSHSVGLFLGPCVDIDVARVRTEIATLRGQERFAPALSSDPASEPTAAKIPTHPLLAGFDLPDCETYAAWLNHQRLHFADCVIAIYEDLAARAAATGNTDLAIDYAYQIERVDPLLERNQARLIRLLMSSGRTERALKQYEMFAARLQNELDVPPEPGTLLLRDQIMKQQGAVPLWPDAPTTMSSGAASHTGRRCSVTVLCAAYYATAACGDACKDMAHTQQVRAALTSVLRQHGGNIMAHAGLGISAWFTRSDGRDCGCHAALLAACEAMASTALPQCLRIGIYTGMATIDADFELASELNEVAELATRMSLIAEDGDIVACTATLRGQPLKAEMLGDWKFRGISKPVTAFRLTQPATD